MAPFKCPDCGTWWAPPSEHRCPPSVTTTETNTFDFNGTYVARCACPPEGRSKICPVHGWTVWY